MEKCGRQRLLGHMAPLLIISTDVNIGEEFISHFITYHSTYQFLSNILLYFSIRYQ